MLARREELPQQRDRVDARRAGNDVPARGSPAAPAPGRAGSSSGPSRYSAAREEARRATGTASAGSDDAGAERRDLALEHLVEGADREPPSVARDLEQVVGVVEPVLAPVGADRVVEVLAGRSGRARRPPERRAVVLARRSRARRPSRGTSENAWPRASSNRFRSRVARGAGRRAAAVLRAGSRAMLPEPRDDLGRDRRPSPRRASSSRSAEEAQVAAQVAERDHETPSPTSALFASFHSGRCVFIQMPPSGTRFESLDRAGTSSFSSRLTW